MAWPFAGEMNCGSSRRKRRRRLVVRPTLFAIIIVVLGTACLLQAADALIPGPLPPASAGASHGPSPRHIMIGQPLSGEEENQLAEVVGTVTFISEQAHGCELELSSEGVHLRVTLADKISGAPPFLINSQVRVWGRCLGTYTSQGYKVAGRMTVTGWDQIELIQAAAEHWAAALPATVGDLADGPPLGTNSMSTRVVGNYIPGVGENPPQFQDAANSIPVRGLRPQVGAQTQIEVLALLTNAVDGPVLVIGAYRPVVQPANRPASPALHYGAIGLGAWDTSVEYSDVVVTGNARTAGAFIPETGTRKPGFTGKRSWRTIAGPPSATPTGRITPSPCGRANSPARRDFSFCSTISMTPTGAG